MMVRGITDADIDILRLACAYGLRHTAGPHEWPKSLLWAEDTDECDVHARLTRNDKLRIEQMWADGVSGKAIAREIGVKDSKVWSYIAKHRDKFPHRYRTVITRRRGGKP